MKKPYETDRNNIMKSVDPIGCRVSRMIMSSSASKLADKITAEEDPINLIRLLTGMIGRFENQTHTIERYDGRTGEPVESRWKQCNKCKCIYILMYPKGIRVHIGNQCIDLIHPAVCEYLKVLYNTEQDYGIGMFSIGQYYGINNDFSNGIQHMGVVVQRRFDHYHLKQSERRCHLERTT